MAAECGCHFCFDVRKVAVMSSTSIDGSVVVIRSPESPDELLHVFVGMTPDESRRKAQRFAQVFNRHVENCQAVVLPVSANLAWANSEA